MKTRPRHVDAELTGCVMLTRDAQPCGKPGQAGLPAGICAEHALTVYRAVARLVDQHLEASAATASEAD